jgi:hypothetical protein
MREIFSGVGTFYIARAERTQVTLNATAFTMSR